MTSQQIENVFDLFGFTPLYQRIRYPIEQSGIFEEVEEEMVECFLEALDVDDIMSFEAFSYWFDYFSIVYKQKY